MSAESPKCSTLRLVLPPSGWRQQHLGSAWVASVIFACFLRLDKLGGGLDKLGGGLDKLGGGLDLSLTRVNLTIMKLTSLLLSKDRMKSKKGCSPAFSAGELG